MKNSSPIGIFDSGVGGITVLKEIKRFLPDENVVYFGDTKHLPYGTKSKETVTRLSLSNVGFLVKKNVKIIVVACNTASALSLKVLQNEFSMPIIGVVLPGSEAASKATKNKKIGVIGTTATIQSLAYLKAINKNNKNIKVYSKACPLFVPLVEEGWFNGPIPLLVVKEYLTYFKNKSIDTLVLGCTHYPFLKKVINSFLKNVQLIDSAFETAKETEKILKERNNLNDGSKKPTYDYFVTDDPVKFKKVGSFFLKKNIKNVKLIELE